MIHRDMGNDPLPLALGAKVKYVKFERVDAPELKPVEGKPHLLVNRRGQLSTALPTPTAPLIRGELGHLSGRIAFAEEMDREIQGRAAAFAIHDGVDTFTVTDEGWADDYASVWGADFAKGSDQTVNGLRMLMDASYGRSNDIGNAFMHAVNVNRDGLSYFTKSSKMGRFEAAKTQIVANQAARRQDPPFSHEVDNVAKRLAADMDRRATWLNTMVLHPRRGASFEVFCGGQSVKAAEGMPTGYSITDLRRRADAHRKVPLIVD